jgi:GT2 family glycosyltransferase/glycosyltransferase involved in cell wall biosynthesis
LKERTKELLRRERAEYDRRQASDAWRMGEAAQARSDTTEALRWLERAFRFTPDDQNLAFTLATTRMVSGDALGALALFRRIAARHAVREVFTGLATSALLARDTAEATAATAQALSGFAANDTVCALAARVSPSWCGVTHEGVLRGPPGTTPDLKLDGRAIRPGKDGKLPPRWRQAFKLTATFGGNAVLGSPIDLAAIRRTEGFAARDGASVAGWAWHPGAPDTDPELTVLINGQSKRIVATDLSIDITGAAPLTRPRGFRIPAAATDTVRVLGSDGRDLWGSPIAAPTPPASAPQPRRTDAVSIVIPVYRGAAATEACLRAVLATRGPRDRVIVVNDASPEPALVAMLQPLAASGDITLLPSCPADPARNLGFPAAANAGLRGAAGTDAVLLNSDTLVFPGWLARLRAAVHGASNIGTATPFSNDASIFTYPDPAAPAAMPEAAEGACLAALAAAANPGTVVDVPTGHGFCLYIRAACLHETGLLREDLFAQGYGEENDFCERARALGWRHVAVPAVYVLHEGGSSFGAARDFLLRRNAMLLDTLHPTYHKRIERFIARDSLHAARRRLDAARWRATLSAGQQSVLLISHDGAGGTGRVVRARAAEIRAEGRAPVTLGAEDGVTTVDADAFPNLRFRLPREAPALVSLLAACRPVAVEIHHLLGHDSAIASVLQRLGVAYDVWVHDWQTLCPRLAFVTPEGFYCGEPPASDCDACTSRGEPPAIAIPAAELRARSAKLLAGARTIEVATDDASRRLRRHFPGVQPRIVPWEAAQAPPVIAQKPGDRLLVAVVGAIGVEKGYGILLDCARDAAARALNLHFTVIGYTIDDTPLLQTGRVFITGPFAADEAGKLLAGSGATVAFLPSIWPETWCYALSDIWAAGLPAVVFDIGAPAERMRRRNLEQAGGGWVLPLNLPAPAINDALLRLQGVAVRSG